MCINRRMQLSTKDNDFKDIKNIEKELDLKLV
jgi:hypothetical protein